MKKKLLKDRVECWSPSCKLEWIPRSKEWRVVKVEEVYFEGQKVTLPEKGLPYVLEADEE